MVTLARPPTRSSLKINNRSFQYAAPYLWNELPIELRDPRQILSPSRSPPITHGSSSSLSPLSSSLTRSFFHSELKTWLFGKSLHHRPFSHLPDWFYGLCAHLTFLFCSTAGCVCTVCSTKPALRRFSNALKIIAISFIHSFVLRDSSGC